MDKELTNFNIDISKIMDYISNGYEIQARYIFNTEIFGKYSKKMVPESQLSKAIEMWIILDEYLNNPEISKEKNYKENKDFLFSIYEDYKEDIKK